MQQEVYHMIEDRPQQMVVRDDHPLIGVPIDEAGEMRVHYYTDDAQAEQDSSPESVRRALAILGA
jgi:hypothetical protein